MTSSQDLNSGEGLNGISPDFLPGKFPMTHTDTPPTSCVTPPGSRSRTLQVIFNCDFQIYTLRFLIH